jgi:hypothetical protein
MNCLNSSFNIAMVFINELPAKYNSPVITGTSQFFVMWVPSLWTRSVYLLADWVTSLIQFVRRLMRLLQGYIDFLPISPLQQCIKLKCGHAIWNQYDSCITRYPIHLYTAFICNKNKNCYGERNLSLRAKNGCSIM